MHATKNKKTSPNNFSLSQREGGNRSLQFVASLMVGIGQLEHLPEEHGTALLNESAGEALHVDYMHHIGFIVKDLISSTYPEKLLPAVYIYNAAHI